MTTCRNLTCFKPPTGKSMYCSTVCCSAYHQQKRKPTREQKDKKSERDKARNRTPEAAYQTHKSKAASRGIEFKLTFDEWSSLWEEHWENRGCSGANSLQMCRLNDEGAYEVGNVRIDTLSNNVKEAHYLRSNLNE